ncbi:hypothetical protein QTP86_029683 [Hemibagrus guttatus]|nr:hypothetical protein QTP86_029683 [Hemibagrus guttatus]
MNHTCGDTAMDTSEEETKPLMACERSGSHKSSCDSFIIVHLYYSTASKSESTLSIPAGHVTAESICVLAAKNCGILPVFQSLFALASEDLSFWYPPTQTFKSDESVSVHYRVRFFFSGWFGQGSRATYRYSLSSGRICAVLDYSVIDYLFAQSRSDFVSGCAGVCPPLTAIQECLGLAVLDLWRQAKEKNHRVKEVCKTISYKSCLPEMHRQEIQRMTRLARFQIRKNLKHFLKKLGRCSAGERSLKLKYLMELSAVEPNYGSETFITSCSTVRVSGDGGIQTRSSDGQEWQTFCDFPQITEINMKRLCREGLPAEGRVVTLTRQDDRCLEVEFEMLPVALSFVSLIDNYFRLTTDSCHYFCSEVAPPSLLQDIDGHCHGPITSEFAVHKLKKAGAKNGTFLLRRSPKEFDKYFLMVCLQTPLGIDYKDCLIEKNDRFHLAGIHSSFDSLKQLTDFYKRNTLILSEIPVKLGICCPPQAKELSNLIIIRNSSVCETPSSPTQHRHRPSHMQFHMIKHEDLIWKESLGQGSFTHIYRGCKVNQRDGETHSTDVLLKVLDVEHKNSWESFFEAASFMSQISHKHLLLVYGVSVHKSKNIMVQEFVKYGALDLYLKRSSVSLSWKLDVAKQLACTLNFLKMLEKKEVNREVEHAIKTATLKYKNKMEQSFAEGNLRSAWQGLKNMAPVNTAPSTSRTIQVAGHNPATLPNDLNSFYSRFETENSTQLKELISSLKPRHSALTFYTEDMVRALKKTKINTAPRPDNISGQTLRYCAEQFEGVFQLLFQSSLACSTVLKLWKHSTVNSIPKKGGTIKALNDLCLMALTSLVMKAMERVIKNHIINKTDSLMDPLQFEYRTGRGVDDAKEEKNIVHGNICAKNLLLAREGDPNSENSPFIKLSDPGISVAMLGKEVVLDRIPWVAPEVLEMLKLGQHCDKWSFGTTLWEIFNGGEIPLQRLDPEQKQQFYDRRSQLPCLEWAELADLISQCMQYQAELRPSSRTIIRHLNGLITPDYEVLHASISVAERDSFWRALSKQQQHEVYEERHLKFISSLGKGNFGRVDLCRYDPLGDNTGELVAVKQLQSNKQSNMSDFQREIQTISSLHCDYIVTYRGICYSAGRLSMRLVMEFLPFGSLISYMEKNKDIITTRRMLLFTSQICKTPGRYAPESLSEYKFSHKSDVWSFGVLLHEVFSYCELSRNPKRLSLQRIGCDIQGTMMAVHLFNALKENWRLPAPTMCPPKVYSMMMQCWAFNSEDRPSFSYLQDLIECSLQEEREGAKG